MTRLRADALLLLAAAIWGLAFVFQKSAMDHIGAFTMVGGRAVVAVIALSPLAIWAARTLTPDEFNRNLVVGLRGGIFFFFGAALQQFGLITTTVSNTGFLTALYVILTPVLIWFMRGERPNAFVAAAALISFSGTWCLSGGSLSGFSRGDALVALSAVFWAAHVIATAEGASLGAPALLTAIQFAVVACLGWVCAFSFETVTVDKLMRGAQELAYVGIFSSAVTFLMLTIALKHTTAAEAAILVSMETVFAAIAAYLLLGERLSAVGLTGGTLMFLASLLVQLGPMWKREGGATQ
jgi:drug/metabolite transporter (DMT)-like permease